MTILTEDKTLQQKLGVQPYKPQLAPKYGQMPDNTRELAAFLQSESDRCQSYMYPFHRQWYLNIAAALGAQGNQAETIARLFRVKVKQVPHRVKHQTNVIGGASRRLIGYLSRSNPDIEFLPGDLDNPLQMDYAKAGQRFWDWHKRFDNYRKKELETIEWSVYTGLGIMKTVWDPNGGPTMDATDSDGDPLMGPDGMPLVSEDGRPITFTTGMPTNVVIPSFHFCYGIEARSDDELNWCGEDGWYSFAYAESMWPGLMDRFKLVPEAQYQRTRGYYYRQIAQSIGPQGVYSGLQPESSVQGARFLQAYIRPYLLDKSKYGREYHEKGAFLVLCQGQVVHQEPNPFLSMKGTNPRFDWHPYTIFPCYTYPGRFIGQGLPENLIPLQDAINFVNSRVREAQRTMGQPKWFIPEGSNVARDRLTGEAGERVKFNPSHGPPIAWTPPPMPAYIFNMLERYYQDIEVVASQPPMMQGRAQGQIRSGLGVQLLQEQALTEFTPILTYFDHARERIARNTILREVQFSEFPRRVQWRGPQGWEQEVFFGKRLAPDFNVAVKTGTSIPRSKALVMSEIDRMVAWGVLQPGMIPAHNEIVARSMEYNVPPITPDNEAENISSARYTIARMLAGDEVAVMPTDNHTVHVNEIVRFMQSRKYREKAERDPTLHQRFMYRLGKHRFFLTMRQMGMDVPQPIPPFEDMQQIYPEGMGAVQATAGGGGPSTGAGVPNAMNAGMKPSGDLMANMDNNLGGPSA